MSLIASHATVVLDTGEILSADLRGGGVVEWSGGTAEALRRARYASDLDRPPVGPADCVLWAVDVVLREFGGGVMTAAAWRPADYRVPPGAIL